MCSELKNTT